MLKRKTPQEIFSTIHNENVWGNAESASGSGSTLRYTENIRRQLPEIFSKFQIRSVLDAPCGDFNWIQHAVNGEDVQYIGADIVPALIEENAKRYSSQNVRFIVSDITKDDLPSVDLLFCRDCLFHLSYDDALRVLHNYLRSGIPYIMTTTHINQGDFENKNILTGDYRRIDLFSSPFMLPRDVLYRVDDWVEPFPPREMCIWSREQIESRLQCHSAHPETHSAP